MPGRVRCGYVAADFITSTHQELRSRQEQSLSGSVLESVSISSYY